MDTMAAAQAVPLRQKKKAAHRIRTAGGEAETRLSPSRRSVEDTKQAHFKTNHPISLDEGGHMLGNKCTDRHRGEIAISTNSFISLFFFFFFFFFFSLFLFPPIFAAGFRIMVIFIPDRKKSVLSSNHMHLSRGIGADPGPICRPTNPWRETAGRAKDSESEKKRERERERERNGGRERKKERKRSEVHLAVSNYRARFLFHAFRWVSPGTKPKFP
ncbi:hypothetical protein D8B26_003769 [Coccidioides posadasii str. Silveira]|uniref:uncharacterized protein n=1 Tax=Coccidioides posadasii (strain RMSCC 757 / Silveira) TaxID=443226 RepID=UPI001BEED4DF|nr:hypothetical protein D8B26_003769 [Coccidioides posadasii str. Silveira]